MENAKRILLYLTLFWHNILSAKNLNCSTSIGFRLNRKGSLANFRHSLFKSSTFVILFSFIVNNKLTQRILTKGTAAATLRTNKLTGDIRAYHNPTGTAQRYDRLSIGRVMLGTWDLLGLRLCPLSVVQRLVTWIRRHDRRAS